MLFIGKLADKSKRICSLLRVLFMTHTQRFWVVLFMINTNYVHEFQGEEKGRKEEEGRGRSWKETSNYKKCLLMPILYEKEFSLTIFYRSAGITG